MGLFDRIKKAFTGNNEKEEKAKEVDQPASEESTEQEEPKNLESNTETTEKEATPESTEQKSTEKETAEERTTDESNSEAAPTANEQTTEDEKAVSGETQVNNVQEQAPVEEATTQQPEPVNEKPEDSDHNDTYAPEQPSSEVSREESTESAEDDQSEVEVSEDNADTEESSNDSESDEASEVKEYDEGLKKSRTSFSERFNKFLANFRSVDEEFFDDLEELLIESDVGYETALRISDELREEVKLRNAKKRSDVSDVIVEKLVDMYDEEGKEEDNALHFSQDDKPTVFLFVGVNGAGKTTTIGKLAHRFQSQGNKVLLAAGDTFRAGAIEQLQRWGERVDVPVEAKPAQTDPASVVYDALHRAIDENFDILLVDTAGRLQNNQNLMRELEKIKRVISREIPEAPQEVLLVLDGSTGQNALSQAKQFKETTDVSGIVLTKLDGSSQGGIVLAIRNELHLPVKLVGLGEQMDDLRDFDAEKFIYGLFKDLIVGSGD